jgi:hypothetical protein
LKGRTVAQDPERSFDPPLIPQYVKNQYRVIVRFHSFHNLAESRLLFGYLLLVGVLVPEIQDVDRIQGSGYPAVDDLLAGRNGQA